MHGRNFYYRLCPYHPEGLREGKPAKSSIDALLLLRGFVPYHDPFHDKLIPGTVVQPGDARRGPGERELVQKLKVAWLNHPTGSMMSGLLVS